MATQVDRRVMMIDVAPGKGFDRLNRRMKTMNKNTLRMRDSLSRMNTAFAALGGAFTGRALSGVVDQFQEVEQRFKIFLGDAERAEDMINLLSEAAQRTFSSFEGVATVMTRLLIMGKNLNATYGDFLKVAEGISASFVLSGATVQEATNAARQLVQGLGSGTLQGEELRAVLEQNALIAQRLADHFEVGVGELRDMASEGKLLSQEVFEALKAGSGEWIKTMENFSPSMRQSMAMMSAALGSYLNDVNKATGFTIAFGDAAKYAAQNLDSIMRALGALALGALSVSLLRLTKFMVFFATKNPIVVGISAAITAWAYLDSDMSNTFKRMQVWTELMDGYFAKTITSIRAKLLELAGPAGGLIFGDKESIEADAKAIESYMDSLYVSLGKLNGERRKLAADEGGDSGLPDWLKEFAGTGGKPPGNKKAAADAAKDWAALKNELDPINAALDEYSSKLTLINQQEALSADLKAEYVGRAKELMLEATGVRAVMDELDPTATFVRQIDMLEQLKDAVPEYSDAISDMILNLHGDMDSAMEGTLEKQKSLIQEVSTFVADQAGRMADAFVEFATDAEFTVSDMVEAMLKDLARLVIFQTVTQPLATAVAGSFGQGGGAAPIQEGLASGGPVSPGVPYTVGERGPETFIPRTAGRIMPNGAGGNTNVQVINNTGAETSTESTRQPDGSELIRVIVGEVAKDISRNGSVGKSIQQMYGTRVQGVTR
jgi:tape measure domain-containing protein